MSSGAAERRTITIRRLVGVYNANGTLRGELTYFLGARLGRSHCALCDITHGLVRERPEWKACRTRFRAPFDTYHRNDQPEEVRVAFGGAAPVVLAQTDTEFLLLLGPRELSACAGSIEEFIDAIEGAVDARSLSWPN